MIGTSFTKKPYEIRISLGYLYHEHNVIDEFEDLLWLKNLNLSIWTKSSDLKAMLFAAYFLPLL